MWPWRARPPVGPRQARRASSGGLCSPSTPSSTSGTMCFWQHAPQASGPSSNRARPRDWHAPDARQRKATRSRRRTSARRPRRSATSAISSSADELEALARALGPRRGSVDGVHPPLALARALVSRRSEETASRFPAPRRMSFEQAVWEDAICSGALAGFAWALAAGAATHSALAAREPEPRMTSGPVAELGVRPRAPREPIRTAGSTGRSVAFASRPLPPRRSNTSSPRVRWTGCW